MTQIIKGLGTLHTPTYAVFGSNRRKLIQQRNSLRSFIKNFSWNNQINNDLYSIYGPSKNIIDKDAEAKILIKAEADLDALNKKLQEPYS